MVEFFKKVFRPIKNILFTIIFNFYDLFRYLSYSGMLIRDSYQRDFRLIKIYHTLEKSLSFRFQKKGAGKVVESLLRGVLKPSQMNGSFSEKVAKDVLDQFADKDKKECLDLGKEYLGGASQYSKIDLNKGVLENPDSFFLSRFTVRDFSDQNVDKNDIFHVLELASKTPSSCNRQPWFSYYLDDKVQIQEVLSIQGGANGFSEKIPGLFIVAVDQRAYDTAVERYQGWIDGGMYGMSLIYACHSLGLATCCLNWAKNIRDDRKLRQILPISKQHSILMMVAVGKANDEFKVCCSTRTPLSEKFLYLENSLN